MLPQFFKQYISMLNKKKRKKQKKKKEKRKKSPSDCHNYFQIFIVLLLKDFLRKFTSLEELKEVKVVFIYIYIYVE